MALPALRRQGSGRIATPQPSLEQAELPQDATCAACGHDRSEHVETLDGPECDACRLEYEVSVGDPDGPDGYACEYVPPTADPGGEGGGREVISTHCGTTRPNGSSADPLNPAQRDDRDGWTLPFNRFLPSSGLVELMTQLAEKDRWTNGAWSTSQDPVVLPGQAAALTECGQQLKLYVCPNGHAQGRKVRPDQCQNRGVCPFCSQMKALSERSGPTKELLSDLGSLGVDAGVAQVELTMPRPAWGNVGWTEITRLRELGVQLLEELWHRKGWPGDPATWVNAHLTSSSEPWIWKPHLHAILVAVGRFDAKWTRWPVELDLSSDGVAKLMDLDPVEAPDVSIEQPSGSRTASITVDRGADRDVRSSRATIDVSLAQDGDTVTVRDDTIREFMAEHGELHHVLEPADAGDYSTSPLFLEDADLRWLKQRWGELVELESYADAVQMRPKGGGRCFWGMDVKWRYAHWHDDDWLGRGITGEQKIRHWVNYNSRSWLTDLNGSIERVEGDQVLVRRDAGPGQDTTHWVPLDLVLRGIERRLDTPRRFHQAAWYGWLSDARRRESLEELAIEYETKEQRRERLAEEAATCPECGAELEHVGHTQDRDKVDHFLETGQPPGQPPDPDPPSEGGSDAATNSSSSSSRSSVDASATPRSSTSNPRHSDGSASSSCSRSPTDRRDALTARHYLDEVSW